MGNLKSLILYWLYNEIKKNAYFKHSFYTFFYIVLRFNEIDNLIHSLDEKILDILCSLFNFRLVSLGRKLSTILELNIQRTIQNDYVDRGYFISIH